MKRVHGACPACGQRDLALTRTGHLVCLQLDCPHPAVIDELLTDPDTAHTVQLDPDDFTLQHPLLECLDGSLFDCRVHAAIAAHDGPPADPGRYRVRLDGAALVLTPIPSPTGRNQHT